ncbi:hypothetical protein PIB30_033048 [Stylosanthes scabra]|uniref:Uncharacterized protein n=1 Tax=Stylosanthes scabra TaxID=79078 RepID=A0ABU6Y9L0_9FABA|nr:hypothetical protein [Stylosanthes scabra]
MPETIIQMDAKHRSFFLKGMLKEGIRNQENPSTISGSCGYNVAASTVTLHNQNPLESGPKVYDRTARRERISKLFNARNQSIPHIFLERTTRHSISDTPLNYHSNEETTTDNESSRPPKSNGSLEIYNVTLTELKSKTKGKVIHMQKSPTKMDARSEDNAEVTTLTTICNNDNDAPTPNKTL